MRNVDALKNFLFPGLVTIIGLVASTLLSEIRTDVKTLLDKTARLEEQVKSMDARVTRLEVKVVSTNLRPRNLFKTVCVLDADKGKNLIYDERIKQYVYH